MHAKTTHWLSFNTAFAAQKWLVRALRIATPFLCACLTPAAGAQEAPRTKTCEVQSGFRATVTRVIDGETIGLDDGREVRLIGALAPRASDVNADDAGWTPENAAVAALSQLVLGKTVSVTFAGRMRDRYGRALAHIFISPAGDEGTNGQVWVQGRMLTLGHARAYAIPGNTECLAELIANEAVAREAALGLWENRSYRVRDAQRVRDLMASRGTFQVMEGTIAKVAETKSATYLNFGRDWHTDFTIAVPAALKRGDAAFAKLLGELAGARVRVRGWIERRNGPMITLDSARQIEILAIAQRPEPVAGDRSLGRDDLPEHGDEELDTPATNLKVTPNENRPAGEPGDINL